ncbi:hypothetical protein QBC47DRAFT_83586 [Echria macrotheca]|uniref:Uncharacterized protein n=1 Tax=Echria macrotheca TaxID=438768 RepID=A0AAJ0F7D9_9PEZI|nr:hypothetical protein QBC47DRAFT_83586 [Echria macrotheca]
MPESRIWLANDTTSLLLTGKFAKRHSPTICPVRAVTMHLVLRALLLVSARWICVPAGSPLFVSLVYESLARGGELGGDGRHLFTPNTNIHTPPGPGLSGPHGPMTTLAGVLITTIAPSQGPTPGQMGFLRNREAAVVMSRSWAGRRPARCGQQQEATAGRQSLLRRSRLAVSLIIMGGLRRPLLVSGVSNAGQHTFLWLVLFDLLSFFYGPTRGTHCRLMYVCVC